MNRDDDLIERVAREIAQVAEQNGAGPWDHYDRRYHDARRDEARAVLTALSLIGPDRKNWLAPIDASNAMRSAGAQEPVGHWWVLGGGERVDEDGAGDIYAAMRLAHESDG